MQQKISAQFQDIVQDIKNVLYRFAASLPVVGHFISAFQYISGDKDEAIKTFKSATRATVVIIGGIGGFALFGPLGAIFGGILGGQVNDLSLKLLAGKNEGSWACFEAEDQKTAEKIFNLLFCIAFDGVSGYFAGKLCSDIYSRLKIDSLKNSNQNIVDMIKDYKPVRVEDVNGITGTEITIFKQKFTIVQFKDTAALNNYQCQFGFPCETLRDNALIMSRDAFGGKILTNTTSHLNINQLPPTIGSQQNAVNSVLQVGSEPAGQLLLSRLSSDTKSEEITQIFLSSEQNEITNFQHLYNKVRQLKKYRLVAYLLDNRDTFEQLIWHEQNYNNMH